MSFLRDANFCLASLFRASLLQSYLHCTKIDHFIHTDGDRKTVRLSYDNNILFSKLKVNPSSDCSPLSNSLEEMMFLRQLYTLFSYFSKKIIFLEFKFGHIAFLTTATLYKECTNRQEQTNKQTSLRKMATKD